MKILWHVCVRSESQNICFVFTDAVRNIKYNILLKPVLIIVDVYLEYNRRDSIYSQPNQNDSQPIIRQPDLIIT
jgi:hypothetical protein